MADLTACPHCGSTDTFTFRDHKITQEFTGIFRDPDSVEHTETYHAQPPPMYATCDACGKRIKLADLVAAGSWRQR